MWGVSWLRLGAGRLVRIVLRETLVLLGDRYLVLGPGAGPGRGGCGDVVLVVLGLVSGRST